MGGKSEYGKQFSPKRSMMSCNQTKVYEDNIGYRSYRRKLEHWHSHDPFLWETRTPRVSSASSSSSTSSAGEGDDTSSSGPQRQLAWRRRDEAVQTPEWDDESLPKTSGRAEKQRRKTAPAATSTKREPRPATTSPKQKIPFLPYGGGFRGVLTGDKQTHNVKAKTDVYPAALRAQKRRQTEIRMRAQEVQKSPPKVKREYALFNEKVARDTDRWQTEYSSHFPAHSRREYEKSLSARKLGGVYFDACVL